MAEPELGAFRTEGIGEHHYKRLMQNYSPEDQKLLHKVVEGLQKHYTQPPVKTKQGIELSFSPLPLGMKGTTGGIKSTYTDKLTELAEKYFDRETGPGGKLADKRWKDLKQADREHFNDPDSWRDIKEGRMTPEVLRDKVA